AQGLALDDAAELCQSVEVVLETGLLAVPQTNRVNERAVGETVPGISRKRLPKDGVDFLPEKRRRSVAVHAHEPLGIDEDTHAAMTVGAHGKDDRAWNHDAAEHKELPEVHDEAAFVPPNH